MKELDYAIAQARRLYHHYNNLNRDCDSEVVAHDFASIVENLEYIQQHFNKKTNVSIR